MRGFRQILAVAICVLCGSVVFMGCSYDTFIAKVSATEEPSMAKGSILMHYQTGTVLKEKDADKKLPIASMTKLMTTLLVLEALDRGEISLEQSVTVSKNASSMGGSQIFLDANSDYVVSDLLKSIIVSSANDSSVAFAEVLAGSEPEFVARMNQRANELNLTGTQYANCTGLPCAGAYSTARDTAVLTRELITYPIYFNYSKIWTDGFKHPSGRITEMANTNKLVRFYKGCDFGKTGSTSEAGYCLSASAERGDMRLISVVIGAENSKSRFNEVSSMFDFGFANYDSKHILDVNRALDIELEVRKSKVATMNIVPAKDFSVLIKKGEDTTYKIEYDLPDKLTAPIQKGTEVGKARIIDGNRLEEEVALLASESVEELSYWDTVKQTIENWKIKDK